MQWVSGFNMPAIYFKNATKLVERILKLLGVECLLNFENSYHVFNMPFITAGIRNLNTTALNKHAVHLLAYQTAPVSDEACYNLQTEVFWDGPS